MQQMNNMRSDKQWSIYEMSNNSQYFKGGIILKIAGTFYKIRGRVCTEASKIIIHSFSVKSVE